MQIGRQRLEDLARRCGQRAWAVAYALLGNREDAMDAVQQAFLVAVRKEDRVPDDDPWPWFGVVVAHEARNLRRKKRPATNFAEGVDVGSTDIGRDDPSRQTEQAEDLIALRHAVDALPPGERDAVMLTQMAGMTHAMAAQALDVPRQTLTAQARRGRERLAHRLNKQPAGVESLVALLPIVPPVGGLEAATELWIHASMGALASGTTTTTALAGSTLMASKTALVLSLTFAVGVGFLGGALAPSPFADDPTPDKNAGSAHMIAADAVATGDDAPKLSASGALPAGADLQREVADLRAQLATTIAERDELAQRIERAKHARGPLFTFGEMGQLAAVRDADWPEMGRASMHVTKGILEVLSHKEAGTAVPKETYLTIQENVEKMRKYEYRTIGKIPTAAKHNGEITHPITMANLLAAILIDHELPLTDEQVKRINKLGSAFDADLQRQIDRYAPTTPRVERMMDEYRLKGKFTDDLVAVLTPEQRGIVFDAETKGLAGLDLVSPTLMILHTSPVMVGPSIEDIRGRMHKLLTQKLSLEPAEADALDGLLDTWSQDVRSLLAPVPQTRVKHYSYEQGDVAGQATLNLTRRILQDVRLSESARAALLDDYAIYVPRILQNT